MHMAENLKLRSVKSVAFFMHMAENLKLCSIKSSTFFMHMAVRTSNYVV